MPVYCYKCKSCMKEFEVRHSMNFEEQKCTECDSNDVFKVPSLGKINNIASSAPKAGKIVDEYIRDVKKEIEKEKKKLKSEEM